MLDASATTSSRAASAREIFADRIALRDFTVALSSGIRPALAFLNATTRFRFTTLYRLERGVLRGAALYDRENPVINCAPPPDAPDRCYLAAGIPLASAAAGEGEHSLPASPSAPPAEDDSAPISHDDFTLRLPNGAIIGMLSHTDARPRLLVPAQQATFARLATDLALWLADGRETP